MTGLEEVAGGGDLNGTMGVGGRVQFSPPIPVLSIAIVGQGVYYLPDCGGVDCSYMTYGLGGKFGLGLPLISPYVIAGYQWRRDTTVGTQTIEKGFTAGAGVQLGMVPIFLEATMEFNDEIPTATNFDVNPLVIQAGILFGG